MNNTLQEEISELLAKIVLPEKMGILFSADSPLDKPVHGMPRLNVLLAKQMLFRLYEKGRLFEQRLEAPAFYYCTASGYQWAVGDSKQERRAISFCYFKEYIRVVIFNSRNDIIYYHTPEPLSPAGFKLIEALESLQQEGTSLELLGQLMRTLFSITVNQIRNMKGQNSLRLNRNWGRINAYLRAHRKESLSREKIALMFHLSPGSLSRLAKKYTGMEFSKLRNLYKLELADELLRSTDMTIEEIAEECGFNYTSYFHRCFLEHFGMTPKKRRESLI